MSHSHSSPRDASLCPYSHPSIVFYFLATPPRGLSSTSVFLFFPYMSEQPLPSAPVCPSQTRSKNITNSYTARWCFPQSTLFVHRSCQCEANGSAPGFYLGSRRPSVMAGCERRVYSPLAQCQPRTGRSQWDEKSSPVINRAGASASQRRTRRCKSTIVIDFPFSFFHLAPTSVPRPVVLQTPATTLSSLASLSISSSVSPPGPDFSTNSNRTPTIPVSIPVLSATTRGGISSSIPIENAPSVSGTPPPADSKAGVMGSAKNGKKRGTTFTCESCSKVPAMLCPSRRI